ncbi:Sn1-specific diacylglycerol lipase alpha [Porphyridium purpureum]|uniref:Sn1-specific diacylglycerol lipase alpha n=1 Tax=Porphyridium purpureum TaxID=35688 RepID=A0A5J4YLR5_PORPP|nr:Sn1-specific diacylglycerol lipase alpha [Porphyridium purpureum]|eukprot:POR4287..scf244_11
MDTHGEPSAESEAGWTGHVELAHLLMTTAQALNLRSEHELSVSHLSGALYFTALRHDEREQTRGAELRTLIDATENAERRNEISWIEHHLRILENDAETLARVARYAYFADAAYKLVESVENAVHACNAAEELEVQAYQATCRGLMPAHFVVVEVSARRCVMSIRGSKEWRDFCADLTFATAPLLGGQVHKGFLKAALALQQHWEDRLVHILSAQGQADELVITGHSLGGAVAMLLAILLRTKARNADIFTRARTTCVAIAPAPCVSENLIDCFKPFTTTLVLGYDVVPRLSATSLERVLHELAQVNWENDAANTFAGTLANYFSPVQREALAGLALALWQRYMGNNFEAVRRTTSLGAEERASTTALRTNLERTLSEETEHIELYVGGRIFYLRHFCSEDMFFLCDLPARALLNVVPSLYKLHDHRMQNIISALEQAMAARW